MSNKPEKRKLSKDSLYLQYDKGYNHCWDEREAWLPSEKEIQEIYIKCLKIHNMGFEIELSKLEAFAFQYGGRLDMKWLLAKAIAKRLGSER